MDRGSSGADIPLPLAPGKQGDHGGENPSACPARRQQDLPGRPCPCTHGKSWEGGDAAERPCCRDTQTGAKDREEEPCLLCPCSNLKQASKHSVPCTAYNTMLCDVKICRRREENTTGIYSNEDLREVMLQPEPFHLPESRHAYACAGTRYTQAS